MDGRSKEIDVKILQQAFQDSGMLKSHVARNMGWYEKKGRADGVRFTRAIGLKPYQKNLSSRKAYYTISTTNYERAVELVLAMGLDPTDYGL